MQPVVSLQLESVHYDQNRGQKKLAQLTEGLWKQAKASAPRAVVRDMLLDDGQVYMDRARELASQQPEEWRELSEQMGSLFDARDKGSQAGGDETASQAGGDDTISQAGGQAGDDETTFLRRSPEEKCAVTIALVSGMSCRWHQFSTISLVEEGLG
ncbi:hypothetical protein Tdes44962_MAKER01855 [Teratosphaeria destructans]|uniref:Uncharacterized protein n=1 Tax=Teratosphaeria destructans TaxID=418781 RepID=A0A9W7SX27_9PEZI|nr:hypothetical protein Tdes44962_MAKER01855 [Teratosphaeria destructans]